MPDARHVEADLDHRLLELLAVLGGGDGLGVGADHLRGARDADQAPLVELHRHVEPGLAAERRQHGVGPLPLDDPGEHLGRERLDVGAVGEVGVGHDRRRVGVGEHHPVALLAQHPAGLGAGVVELARLADDDRAGADDQDRLEVVAAGHQALRRTSSRRSVRKVGAVVGAGSGLGVVLHAEGADVGAPPAPRTRRR